MVVEMVSLPGVKGVNGVNNIIWISENDWPWGALYLSLNCVDSVNSVN